MQQRGSNLNLRLATAAEAAEIVRVHFAAVHQTAASNYDHEILAQWSTPISTQRIAELEERMRSDADGEITVVAERENEKQENEIVGFGSICPRENELRAVYVSPHAGRSGVGSAILAHLEQLAKQNGMSQLVLDSSLTARDFYLRHGFTEIKQDIHKLRSGGEMVCIRMKKRFEAVD
jgi:putative acetyltransferase